VDARKGIAANGKHVEAMSVFAELVRDFPDSLRAPESKFLWATSAAQSGKPIKFRTF
jgi:TolA-binding protein